MDASEFPTTSALHRLVAACIESHRADPVFDGYDTDLERLFAFLVAGTELYVRALMADSARQDMGEPVSLAALYVDNALLEDPDSFGDLDREAFKLRLNMTLTAVFENLE